MLSEKESSILDTDTNDDTMISWASQAFSSKTNVIKMCNEETEKKTFNTEGIPQLCPAWQTQMSG